MSIPLSAADLAAASAFVVLLGVTTWLLRLGMFRPLMVATVRLVIQLLLVGMVLKALFSQTAPGWVALMASVMLAIAGREVMARQKRRLAGWAGYGIGTCSLFVSSFALAVFALLAAVQPTPWYTPQYAIPILGMLLGNTMSGIALASDRLTSAAWEQRSIIEQRLMLGEPRREAIGDLLRDSLRSGMMPVINSMVAAGLVSLPGMMTGQILAGAPPVEAVKYQIFIWLLIAAGTGFGQVIAVTMTARALFDQRDRLRLDRLAIPSPG